MTTNKLHANYILLHEFEHPNDPMKAWVKNDEGNVGHYHTDYESLMELCEKIESLGFSVIIKNDSCLIERTHFRAAKFNTISKLAESKKMAMYLAFVEFATWYKQTKS